MMDLSINAAILAGVLSFFSPCVLPIVPGYLGYLGSLQNGNASGEAAKRFRLVMASLFFVAGFVSVFLLIGVSSTVVGSMLARHMVLFQQIAGALIILLGVHFLGLIRLGWLDREMRYMPNFKSGGVLTSYVVGLAFGFGWTPCVGPVLATIFLVVASSTESHDGLLLLLAYGLGIGIPFVAVAFFAEAFTKRFRGMSRLAPIAKYTLGVLMVLTGGVMVSGKMNDVGFWMLRTFSSFQTVG